MQISTVNRKYILLMITAFLVVGIIVANILANKQDKEFEMDNVLYQQAIEMYQAGNYEEAKLVISGLVMEQADSEVVNQLAGLIEASNNEYSAAAVYMQKALDINPYKVEEPMFMLQFGEILLRAERLQDAKLVLNRCKDSNWEPNDYPDYQAQVQDLLSQIENMK